MGSSPFSMFPFGRSQWPAGYFRRRYLGPPGARLKTTAPADLSSRRSRELEDGVCGWRAAGLASTTCRSLGLRDGQLPVHVDGYDEGQDDRHAYRELVAEQRVDPNGDDRSRDDAVQGRPEVVEGHLRGLGTEVPSKSPFRMTELFEVAPGPREGTLSVRVRPLTWVPDG